MFERKRRGLFDLLMASLCLWGAAYHTPAGALLRDVAGRVFGFSSETRPLLAYYSGGVYDAPRATEFVTAPALAMRLPPGEVLAHGVLAELESDASIHEVAREVGVTIGAKPRATDVAKLIDAAKVKLGSEEAAIAAVFCGWPPVAWAVERGGLSLEALSMRLPPRFAPSLAKASRALSLGTAYALSWPVAESTRISSSFGWRTHPTLKTRKLHTGVDLAVPIGTPVRVTAAGVVRRASEDAVNGRVLIVDHGRGVTTAYCHNSELLVTTGARVEAGDVISQSGNTGRSSGPHLHYQLELGSRPVDPLAFRAMAPSAGVEGR